MLTAFDLVQDVCRHYAQGQDKTRQDRPIVQRVVGENERKWELRRKKV